MQKRARVVAHTVELRHKTHNSKSAFKSGSIHLKNFTSITGRTSHLERPVIVQAINY